MLIEITGFLADSSEDNSIKLKINVQPEFERTVMNLMGWKKLDIRYGGTPLTRRKAQQISAVINKAISTDLNLYIGVRLSDEEVAERHRNTVEVVFLSIIGFYSNSWDDSLQYEGDVTQELEPRVLAAMGWASMQHVPPDEHILTTDQVNAVMTILGDPVRDDLVYYMGACVKRIPLPN